MVEISENEDVRAWDRRGKKGTVTAVEPNGDTEEYTHGEKGAKEFPAIINGYTGGAVSEEEAEEFLKNGTVLVVETWKANDYRMR